MGRPDLSRYGEFMVALLGAGPGAVLSHESAAELWDDVARPRARDHVLATMREVGAHLVGAVGLTRR